MKAVGYKQSLPVTASEALEDIELPTPEAQGRDLLVRVEAVSVNPVDTKIRQNVSPEGGEYKVLGWDAAGVVEAVGEDVTLFQPGDKVWYAGAVDRSGTNAQFHQVDERIVSKMPTSLGFAEAAALPLTTITAWEMLFDRLQVAKENAGSLLIIGASGGVGSIMIQLAKQLTDLTVIATASRPETRAWAQELGADHVIDHRQSLVDELKAADLPSVNYVASLTHTDEHLAAIAELIAPQGRLAVIDDPASFDIMPFKRKSVSVHWEFMFTRSLFQTEDMIEQHRLLERVAEMVDRGELTTTLAEEFGTINAENLLRAHALLESGKGRGKIVLRGF
ncbi:MULTISPECIES: zinc-binding alcohol dehydrogenase family protein [Halomonadaceae]|uniref:Zinc-type alcohol dehydrogenase-like protein n=1 Tax=Onishia taeanensis TaxID=284577 RepID=A0A328XUI3_9GAMM|nr:MULTISPECIES: zinc-binding alcohol dehydrogenase family protein [Halomonas]RAR63479.1 zinc-binding alcohol dehydrogenase family protein [Halomonas taeanensis]